MWLWLPTSVSSPVSEDLTLPSDSLFQRLARSAMWRSKHLRSASWRRVWKTAPWIRRLCGVTFEPSRQDSIVAAWLEQFSVSPVRISLSQESRKDLSKATEVDSSTPPCGSFARLDASGVFLKTSLQFSLFPQDVPYSESLPKAGSMRTGFLFARPTWERPTDENECSSWPTARAEDSECCENHPGAQDSLGGATRNWTSPNARDADKWHNRSADEGKQQNLSGQTHHWKTPHAMGNLDASGKIQLANQAVEELWQTPQVDSFRSRGGDRKDEMGLDQQARRQFPSPAGRDYRSPNARSFQERGGADEGRTASEFHRALFPPGPADRERWAEIIAESPDLAPAVEYEVRDVAARLAAGMDFARADQLRGLGNMVVPQQGALAFLILLGRSET